jgi:glycyl-tRNA synthetase
MLQTTATMEKIVSLTKRRCFVFPGSEIYGGFAGTYDWGPLGVLLRANIVNAWVRAMMWHDNVALIDSSIFTAPEVWVASGHVSGFNDPLVVCLECHSKLRADHLLEAVGVTADEKMTEEKLNELFASARDRVTCPVCNRRNFSRVVQKNLMATATLGKLTEEDKDVYLRAETAQGIYINYKNVLDTGMYRVPFGLAQVGKAFRNEISPRQFLFRKREFEQMEMQYFVAPAKAAEAYEAWKRERMDFYHVALGIKQDHLRFKKHDNLVFYAKEAWDIEYNYPFGWAELEGVHHRGDYDLTQHQKHSGVDMSFYDEETKQRFIPNVIETSAGLDRTVLAVLADAYAEDEMGGEKRVVLRFQKDIAPYRAAVSPLLRNKPALVEKAREVFLTLKKEFGNIAFDDNGNIGKRYRRQDEIGTPHCIVIDFDTLGEGETAKRDTVTVRERDSGAQERIIIADMAAYLRQA